MNRPLKRVLLIRLRYKLPILNSILLLWLCVAMWPVPPDHFDFMPLQYVDPIVLWDYQAFILAMHQFWIWTGMPFNLHAFAIVTYIIRCFLLIVAGSVQWFLIGILFERIVGVLKPRIQPDFIREG